MKLLLLFVFIISLNADCSKLRQVLDKEYYPNLVNIMSKSYYKYVYPKEIRHKQVKEINAANQVKQSVISVFSSCNNISKENLQTLYKIRIRMSEVSKRDKVK